jgi:glutaminyl-tRNA synthetase
MPTLVGARRRGYTPAGFRLFNERIGVSKSESWIDIGVLEDAMREDLNAAAPRRIAVLDPIRLVIDNYPEERSETMSVPNHPQHPELGRRDLPFSRELWIERDDFSEAPPKGYFRLAPGAEVRLRYAYVVRCTGVETDAQGDVVAVHCTYDETRRSGTAGADARKVKGNIHWLPVADAARAEVRLYDRLFRTPFPGARERATEVAATEAATASVTGDDDEPDMRERSFLDDLNPDSKRTQHAYVEPALAAAVPEARFQFERHGYFVADLADHAADHPVFNRTVTRRDSWNAKPGRGR